MWDFVYARRLLSNGTYRPIHDAVLGFEHCMVAKAALLAQVKTDCLLTQPKRSRSGSGAETATRTARRSTAWKRQSRCCAEPGAGRRRHGQGCQSPRSRPRPRSSRATTATPPSSLQVGRSELGPAEVCGQHERFPQAWPA